MADLPAWKLKLDEAWRTMQLADTYFDDGAYLTAADRLGTAARLLRQASAERRDWIDASAKVRP